MVVRNTRSIMLLVTACMAPGLLLQALLISPRLLINLGVAATVALLTEALCLKLRGVHSQLRMTDGASLITALIIAAAMPPAVPLGVLVLATVTAVGLGKHAYGGLGNNVFNPAMVGYAVALLSFPLALSGWPTVVDSLSGATPLTVFEFRGAATVSDIWQPENGFGQFGAAGWEWVNLAYMAGGLVLLAMRLAAWRVVAGMLAGMGLLAAAGYDNGSSASFGSPLYHWFTGSTMLAAFFVVTDPVTHPNTLPGQWLFGLLVGALTLLIRTFGSYPDGIAFAVLLANAATPYLDRRLAVAADSS
jgi:Na+-translocating ferredoxin:NAD+ oxidoreductase subunit D